MCTHPYKHTNMHTQTTHICTITHTPRCTQPGNGPSHMARQSGASPGSVLLHPGSCPPCCAPCGLEYHSPGLQGSLMDVMQLELVGLQGGCYGYRRILSERQPQVNALRLNIPWEWWGAVPQGEERWPPAWTGWGVGALHSSEQLRCRGARALGTSQLRCLQRFQRDPHAELAVLEGQGASRPPALSALGNATPTLSFQGWLLSALHIFMVLSYRMHGLF